MKVYVVTRAKPMGVETYVSVKAKRKEAEKVIRAEYPNARSDDHNPAYISYECHKGDKLELMFIREEEI